MWDIYYIPGSGEDTLPDPVEVTLIDQFCSGADFKKDFPRPGKQKYFYDYISIIKHIWKFHSEHEDLVNSYRPTSFHNLS